MSKRLIAVMVATCAIFLSALPTVHAQSESEVKNRLADLESKVETLLRENTTLRGKVTELESSSVERDATTREDVELTRELEQFVNALNTRQDQGVLSRPAGVDFIFINGETRTRVDFRSNTGDVLDSIDDEGLRLDYRFNLGFGFNFSAKNGVDFPARVTTYFEMQAAGRAANNTAEDLTSGISGAGAGQFETRGNELDDVRLYQAWVKLEDIFSVDGLDLQIGRQDLNFGSGLLLGTNTFFTGTVHDALRIDMELESLEGRVTFFYAKEGAADGQVVPGLATGGLFTGRFRASGDEDEMLGLYSSFAPEGLDPVKFDLYWIYFNSRSAGTGIAPDNVTTSADPGIDSFGRAVIGGQFHTMGFWLRADDLFTDGFYLGVEFAYQFGDDEDGGDIGAMVIEVTAEYLLPFMEESNGRVFAGYYFAEGPDSDNSQGFTPLFISRHNNDTTRGRGFSRFGNIDFIPVQNVHVFQIGFKFEPDPDWLVGITYLNASLNHSTDPITFTPTGRVFADDRHLGHEIDLYAQYRMTASTEFFFNFSVFIPEFDYFFENPFGAAGSFTKQNTDLAVGVYAQIQVRF